MKKTLLTIALLTAFAASAQSLDSTSNSGSQSGANSGSTSGIAAQNSGNASANASGNTNASRSDSASQSGALSGSQSGAMGNSMTVNQNVPSEQRINNNVSGSTSSTSNNTNSSTVNGNSNSNEKYDGTLRTISSGGTNNITTENVHYSGTQTIKNVPGIAMSGPASGPCTGNSGGLGLAGPGWGVGLNGSAVMDDCRMRENTRVLGMGMQSLDGGANPQEKGEATVMFMDAMRGLAAYNNQLISNAVKAK